jgi:hypothetical protein
MYADSTWLSKSGSHSIKPLAMTIGNFPRDSMNQDRARKVTFNKTLSFSIKYCFQVVGYFPELTLPKTHRKKAAAKRFKRKLYHDALYDVLRPVRRAQKDGGFWAMHKGR